MTRLSDKTYPAILLALAMLGAWWALRDLVLPHDVGWQFWTARQMLGGTELYAEIWEVNPPLWFWSAMPLAWVAEQTGAPWGAVLAGAVAGLGALCAGLTAHLLGPRSATERAVWGLLVFAMTVILPASQTGQREPLALIVSLPYAALIARRHAGVTVPGLLAAGVALLAAYGFALKHYFVAVPVVLELWLIARQRAAWRPWRPEVVVLAGLAAAYAAAVVVLTPAFFSVILPMVEAAYFSSQATLVFTLVKPYVLFWVVAGGFLWATRKLPLRAVSPAAEVAIPALLLMWGAFALGYVLQSRGWNYHSIAATGTMGVAVGLRAWRVEAWPARAIGGGMLAALVWLMYPYNPRPAPEEPLLDRVAPGEGVFIADFNAGAIWRRGREDLVWVSRAYSLWMVQAIAAAEAEGRVTPALARLRGEVLAATSQDIRCHPPQLILFKATPGTRGADGAFSFEAFLMRDPALREFLAAHYGAAERAKAGTAYWRRGTVAGLAASACRTIR